MALEDEDDITHSGLVGVPAAEIPGLEEEEEALTPAPTPLVRPPVYETPAPTPLTPPAGYGESGAPTPFVERSHIPIDDKTASDYMAELKTMYPGQNDLRAEHLTRELDLYAATEPEREKYQNRQYLRDVFTDDDALKQFSDTDEMRQRERFSVNPNLERYRAANWMQVEHETGKTIHDDLEYETLRNQIARERDGKPATSDLDFYNSRRKEYELDKQLELAQTELIGKGVLKTISDQAQGKPTEITSVIDEVISKYPDAFPNDAAKDAAAAVLRDSTAMIREQTERLKPDLAVAFPIIQKMVTNTATPEEGMTLYRQIGKMLPTEHDNPDVRAAKRKDIGTIIGLAEMALNSQGEKVDRNALMTELENIKKAAFQGFGWVAQGSITQQEDKLSVGLKTIEDGSAVIGPYGLDFRLPGSPRPGGRDLTPEEQASYTEQLQAGLNVLEAQRIMNDALVKKLDPIEYLAREGTFWGTAERMGLDAIQSLPFMGTAVVAGVLGSLAGGPIGGYAASGAVMTYMTAEQEFQDLTMNDPELDRDARKGYANWSAIAQLPFNYLELELFAGAFPAIGAIFRDLKAGAIGTAIARATGRQLAEFTTETIQNGISDLTQIIAKQANSNLPTKMHQVWDQAVEQGPRTFFAVLPFTLIGTGMASLQEYGVYAKELTTRDALSSAGFSPAQVNMILAGRTIEERTEILQRETPLRDPEVVKAAGAKLAQELDNANQAAGAMQQIAGMPTMERSKKADGTIEYTVKSAGGNVVTTTTSLEQAKLSFGEQAEIAMQEMLVRAEEQEVSEETAAKAAESEATLQILPAVSRASANVVLDFEPNAEPTSEQSESVRRLEAALAKDPRSGGEAISLVIQTPRVGVETGVSQALNQFLTDFQRVFGKEIIFVRSGTDSILPFDGVVLPERPNTIFLDADGHANVAALLGHEWAHTLAVTNPQLHREMTKAMRPLVINWFEQEGLLKEAGYREDDVTDELVSNIVGDAFTRPEFWAEFKQRNPSLFERVVRAIEEWFVAIRAKVMGTEWGTEGFITSLDEMHGVISSAIEQARTAGPESVVAPREAAGVMFARRADRAYMEAVEKGDMEAAQRMVDKVADRAGFTIAAWKGYHPKKETGETITIIERPSEFPSFNKGEPNVAGVKGFFSSDKAVAEHFTEGLGEGAVTSKFRLAFRKPFEIDANGKHAGAIQFEATGKPFRDAVRSGNYDGIIIRNTKDEGTVYVALESKGIKSADPVTYDAQGKVIPLSQRFDIGKQELMFAAKQGKFAQAKAEGPLEREASIEAIFERIHAAPAKRADLVRRAARAFADVRARHLQQLAEFEPPGVPDEEGGLRELEAQETLALEDVDTEEQAALDQNTLNVADRYGERILAEQDITKRRALERQQKLVEAAQRKGIEARFNERRQGVAREFTLRRQALRAQVAEATRAATAEGAAELRRLKQVQTYAELNAILKSLPPDIRGRIPPTPNLADMSDEQLTDFLVKRITQISNVMEFVQKRSFQEAITDLLTRFKPKKSQAGIVKSRIGADAQDVVSRVSKYLVMDGAAVQAESDGIERQLSQGGLTPEQESALIMRQNELETFGAMKEMSAAELETALNELKATIQAGRASWGATEEARLADMHAKAEEVKRVLPAATAPGVAAKNRNILTNLLANFARNHTSFIQILGRIFPGANFVSQWESDAIKRDSADMDFVRATQDRLIAAIGTALGTKSVVKIGSALRAMDVQNIPVPGGLANKREAIQYLFAWGQPKVQERMRNQDWTDEHIRVLQEATMDPASQALMAFFQREYEAIYQRANVVYRKLFGMNLPRIEGTYAPMRYHGAGGPAEITPTGAVVSSGVTPSAIKGRVAHDARLRQVDSLQVFYEHLYQMSHWIHFAEFIRETRGVMNNPEVKLALEQSIGARGITDLQKQLDAVTRNGITRSSEVSGINDVINHITKGVAVGAMAFNMHSAAVQGDSALRWMTAIPIQRWHKAFLNHRWIAAVPTAWHSDTVQRRVMQGTNPAVRLAMERDNLTPSLLLKLVDIGFWHLNYFDGAATAVSSAIVYADALEQGMTHEQAIQKMDEAVARFSQPIAITSKTQALATGGASMKMLLMFMADPMLKTSLAMEGAMNISRGVRNKDVSLLERGIRNIVSVEVWSLVSQTILNAWSHLSGDDEDEDDIWVFRHWLRAALVAPFQGFYVAGNIAEGLARAAFGEKWYLGQPASVRFVEDIRKTATHYEDLLSLDPLDPEFQKELSNIIKVGGAAVGGGWAAGAAAIVRGATAVQAAREKLEE